MPVPTAGAVVVGLLAIAEEQMLLALSSLDALDRELTADEEQDLLVVIEELRCELQRFARALDSGEAVSG